MGTWRQGQRIGDTQHIATPEPRKSRFAGRRWIIAGVGTLVLANLLAIGAYANSRFVPDNEGAPGRQDAVPASVRDGGPLVDTRDGRVVSHRVPDRTIVLTFDDGPDPLWTPQVLDVLHKHGVPATFFVLGSQTSRHPGVRRADGARGSRSRRPHVHPPRSGRDGRLAATARAEPDPIRHRVRRRRHHAAGAAAVLERGRLARRRALGGRPRCRRPGHGLGVRRHRQPRLGPARASTRSCAVPRRRRVAAPWCCCTTPAATGRRRSPRSTGSFHRCASGATASPPIEGAFGGRRRVSLPARPAGPTRSAAGLLVWAIKVADGTNRLLWFLLVLVGFADARAHPGALRFRPAPRPRRRAADLVVGYPR